MVNQGQGSKFKVKKVKKNVSFKAISVDRRSAWVRLGPGRVRPGTIGRLPTFFGRWPKAIEQQRTPHMLVLYSCQVASVIGSLPTFRCASCFSVVFVRRIGTVRLRYFWQPANFLAACQNMQNRDWVLLAPCQYFADCQNLYLHGGSMQFW